MVENLQADAKDKMMAAGLDFHNLAIRRHQSKKDTSHLKEFFEPEKSDSRLAKVGYVNSRGETLLIKYLEHYREPEIGHVKSMLECLKLNVNQKTFMGQTALNAAIKNELTKPETLQALVEAGADPSSIDEISWETFANKTPKVLRFLLENISLSKFSLECLKDISRADCFKCYWSP